MSKCTFEREPDGVLLGLVRTKWFAEDYRQRNGHDAIDFTNYSKNLSFEIRIWRVRIVAALTQHPRAIEFAIFYPIGGWQKPGDKVYRYYFLCGFSRGGFWDKKYWRFMSEYKSYQIECLDLDCPVHREAA